MCESRGSKAIVSIHPSDTVCNWNSFTSLAWATTGPVWPVSALSNYWHAPLCACWLLSGDTWGTVNLIRVRCETSLKDEKLHWLSLRGRGVKQLKSFPSDKINTPHVVFWLFICAHCSGKQVSNYILGLPEAVSTRAARWHFTAGVCLCLELLHKLHRSR